MEINFRKQSGYKSDWYMCHLSQFPSASGVRVLFLNLWPDTHRILVNKHARSMPIVLISDYIICNYNSEVKIFSSVYWIRPGDSTWADIYMIYIVESWIYTMYISHCSMLSYGRPTYNIYGMWALTVICIQIILSYMYFRLVFIYMFYRRKGVLGML